MYEKINFTLNDRPMFRINGLNGLRNISSLSHASFDRLLNAYAGVCRGYHGIFHIAFLWHCHVTLSTEFPEMDAYASRMADAVACHDVIYDATSKTNEIDSANWWREEIATTITQDRPSSDSIDWTAQAIEASADHFADRPMVTQDEILIQWFLGIDLIGLAAPLDIFRRNNLLIRAEYSHLTDAQWIAGQRAFMGRIDRSPVIYRHPFLFEHFEAPARENIKRLLSDIA